MKLSKPKSHKSRSVPVAGFLVRLLNEATSGKQPLDLIFGDGRNYVRQSTSGRGWFAKAVRLSQKDDETFPRVTPHDLRHTAASLAVSAGANVKAVQRMLGHASAAMTLDTYADLFDDDLDAVAVGLDTARSSRIVSMSVSMAPKPYAKEPLVPRVSKDLGVLSLAVPVGFEPTVRFHAHNFSRVAPSAARTRNRGRVYLRPTACCQSGFAPGASRVEASSEGNRKLTAWLNPQAPPSRAPSVAGRR